MLVGSDKTSAIRAHAAVATALLGLGVAIVAQRRQNAETTTDITAQDILRTTHIAPDGERINGAWIASSYADQEFVDLAQNVHTVLSGGRHLPPIVRSLLSQRCHDLEVGLSERGSGYTTPQSAASDSLRKRLSSLRVSLLCDARSAGSQATPLSDNERASLAKLVEAVMYPLCVWERSELRDLRRVSERNLRALRL